MKILNLFSLIIIFIFCSCSDDENFCDAENFLGTVTSTWESQTNECNPDLPTIFTLREADVATNPDIDVIVSHADTTVFHIFFTGEGDDLCTFRIEEPTETADYVGDGTLNKNDQLEMSFRNNDGDYTCTLIGALIN